MILHILSHRTCDFGTILAIYLFALYILVILHRVYLNYTCDFIYFVTSYLRFWNHTCDLPICSLHTCDFTSRVPKLYLRFYIFVTSYLRFWNHTCDFTICSLHTCDFICLTNHTCEFKSMTLTSLR